MTTKLLMSCHPTLDVSQRKRQTDLTRRKRRKSKSHARQWSKSTIALWGDRPLRLSCRAVQIPFENEAVVYVHLLPHDLCQRCHILALVQTALCPSAWEANEAVKILESDCYRTSWGEESQLTLQHSSFSSSTAEDHQESTHPWCPLGWRWTSPWIWATGKMQGPELPETEHCQLHKVQGLPVLREGSQLLQTISHSEMTVKQTFLTGVIPLNDFVNRICWVVFLYHRWYTCDLMT